jgi:hypothetical protein
MFDPVSSPPVSSPFPPTLWMPAAAREQQRRGEGKKRGGGRFGSFSKSDVVHRGAKEVAGFLDGDAADALRVRGGVEGGEIAGERKGDGGRGVENRRAIGREGGNREGFIGTDSAEVDAGSLCACGEADGEEKMGRAMGEDADGFGKALAIPGEIAAGDLKMKSREDQAGALLLIVDGDEGGGVEGLCESDVGVGSDVEGFKAFGFRAAAGERGERRAVGKNGCMSRGELSGGNY